MTPQEAADFLSHDVAWEPGLEVQAVASTVLGRVDVLFTRTVQDSTVILPDGTYPEPGPARSYTVPDYRPFEIGRYPADLSLTYVPPVRMVPVSMSRTYQEHDFRTREELLYRVVQAVSEMHEHDIREFTRVRDSSSSSGWRAPFHPHREDGNAMWHTGGRHSGHAQ